MDSSTAVAASSAMVPLIINGREESGSHMFEVKSPVTGKACWTAASATLADATRAIETAEAAFSAWACTKPAARRNILFKTADILESRRREYANYMHTETGADAEATQHFVFALATRMLRDIAGHITSICGSVPVVEGEGQSAIAFKEPMGVILGIVPWYAKLIVYAHHHCC